MTRLTISDAWLSDKNCLIMQSYLYHIVFCLSSGIISAHNVYIKLRCMKIFCVSSMKIVHIIDLYVLNMKKIQFDPVGDFRDAIINIDKTLI